MQKFTSLLMFLLFIVSSASARSERVIQYLYPIPGSTEHPVETPIIIRFAGIKPDQIENFDSFIQITGEKSGATYGKNVISSDRKTIIFKTENPFIAGENIYVHLHPRMYGKDEAIIDSSYSFSISEVSGIAEFNETRAYTHPEEKIKQESKIQPNLTNYPQVIGGVSVPADFPGMDIKINENPDGGNIFICTYFSPYYAMIFDNSGNPLWYLRANSRRRDLKIQKNGLLTTLARVGYGGGSHIGFDSTFTLVDTFFVPPGYSIDEHELQVLENGHYFLIFADSRRVDMSVLVEGGDPNAYVIGHHFAEMDAHDNPVLIWRAWDYLKIEEVIHLNITAKSFEFVHMNAIEIDHDNNLLISNRNRSEILKLDRNSGEIIWQLGGANNQFTWVNDDQQISYQHDIRVLPDGNYTVFDNGSYHSPRHSRAMELKVDTVKWEVTKIWEYSYDPAIYSKYMGNVQRLPNGNTLINWAISEQPKLSEIRPDGSTAFEMNFIHKNDCYRTFRFPWMGKAVLPYLVVETWDENVTLLFNKFGDPDVVRYNIYGGLTPNPDQIIASTSDPYIHFFDITDMVYYYFRVTAVNSLGEESGFSNEEKVYVRITQPGENMVENGDFSDLFRYWGFYVDTANAQATYAITDFGELHVKISEAGSRFSDIKISYPGLTLVEGREYLFEFDAYADEVRAIEADIKNLANPAINYSKIGYTPLAQRKMHFKRQFILDDNTDFNAGIIINVGTSSSDIYIDNVSLKHITPDNILKDKSVPGRFSLGLNYPNPFNPETKISFNLPRAEHVTLTIYNTLGQKINVLINKKMPAGKHNITFNAKNLPSGIYLYWIKAGEFSDVKKMVLLR